MTTLGTDVRIPLALSASADENSIVVELDDGRQLTVPIAWYPSRVVACDGDDETSPMARRLIGRGPEGARALRRRVAVEEDVRACACADRRQGAPGYESIPGLVISAIRPCAQANPAPLKRSSSRTASAASRSRSPGISRSLSRAPTCAVVEPLAPPASTADARAGKLTRLTSGADRDGDARLLRGGAHGMALSRETDALHDARWEEAVAI